MVKNRHRRSEAVSTGVGVLALAALVASGAPAGAESAAELVARSIRHHGGEIYEHSETSFRICSKGGCYQVVSRMDGGRYSHTVTDADGRRVRITNDDVTMWIGGRQVPVPDAEEQRRRNWVHARVYFAFLPYRLEDPGVVLEDLGTESWDGRALRKVRVSFAADSSNASDDLFLHWFDPETARLVQFAYSYPGDPDGLRFRELFDYRRVGGILFYDQRNLGIERDGITVDDVTPELVSEDLREVSIVRLDEIEVEPVAARE